MKKSLLILLAFLSFSALGSTPIETFVPVDHVYSPSGFDSNDDTEIIISGYLPNLCHKSPRSSFIIKDSKISIELKSLKYEPDNPFCPEVLVPFVEVVKVGILDKGLYEIVVNEESIYEGKSNIYVSESSSDAIDENIYANVEIIERKNNGSRVVELKGYNPSDCFVLDKIEINDNGKDVYSILPKLKQVSDFCPMKMVPFNFEIEVPENLKEKKVLLHVRSMNGKSVNSVYPNL